MYITIHTYYTYILYKYSNKIVYLHIHLYIYDYDIGTYIGTYIYIYNNNKTIIYSIISIIISESVAIYIFNIK